MSNKKLLTSLLCVALVGPLAACDKDATSSTGSTNNSNSTSLSGTPVTGEETVNELEKAAVATKNKLKEELAKDTLSLKLSAGYGGSQTEYDVENTYVSTEKEYVYDLVSSEKKDPETYAADVEIEFFGNLDNKYYKDYLANEGETTLTNTTAAFVKGHSENKQYDKDNNLTSSYSSDMETKITTASTIMRTLNAYGPEDSYYHESVNEFEENADPMVASIVATIDQFVNFTEEEAVAFFELALKELVVGETGMPEETFDSLYSTVIGFLTGTVETEVVVDTFLPLLFPGEEEIPEEARPTYVALLDYVKLVNAADLVDFTTRANGGETIYTLTFDYAGFKTFAQDVFDDIADLLTTHAPSEAEEIMSELEGFEEEFFADLPESVDLSFSVGIRNGLFSSFGFDVDASGFDIEYSTYGNSEYPQYDENGNWLAGCGKEEVESHMTQFAMDGYVAFEFATTPFEIPDFTIEAPVEE